MKKLTFNIYLCLNSHKKFVEFTIINAFDPSCLCPPSFKIFIFYPSFFLSTWFMILLLNIKI